MNKTKFLLVLLTAVLITGCTGIGKPAPTPTPVEIPGWSFVWSDEFELPDGSPPDPANWNYDIGASGWGNQELEYYTERIENAYIQDGMLVIEARDEDYFGSKYTSARIHSKNKADFKYGRFETRAKLPNTQGIWPAIWMMPTEGVYGIWPKSGEIDIVELVGRDPYLVHGTIHYGDPKGDRTESYFLPTLETFDQDFHVFVLEWEPDEFRWYVDGELFHTARHWHTSYPDAPKGAPFDQEFYWILNVAVGGIWPGYPNESSEFPQRMYVDYVRVYQK